MIVLEVIHGKITDIGPNGLTIQAQYGNIDRAILRQYSTVEIGLPDGRVISPEQRKKAHALINEIAEWVGDFPEFIKRQLKLEFVATRMQALNKQLFSLSDCEMSLAADFISYLIDFIIQHQIPCRTPLYELCDDINKYVYSCLVRKVCCICGKKPDLHHVSAIGSGRDRDEVYQIGMLVMPLCREHHGEAHTIGVKSFSEKYHINGIPLTVEIGRKYGLTKRNLSDAS